MKKNAVKPNIVLLRDGRSKHDVKSAVKLFTVMYRGLLNDQLSSPSVVRVVNLGRSIHEILHQAELRSISIVLSLFRKVNEFQPSWMESNSGRSINYAFDLSSPPNIAVLQLWKADLPKRSHFRLDSPIHNNSVLHLP